MSLGDTRHLSRLAMKALFFGLEYRQPEIDALNAKVAALEAENEKMRKVLRMLNKLEQNPGPYLGTDGNGNERYGADYFFVDEIEYCMELAHEALAQIGERNDNN